MIGWVDVETTGLTAADVPLEAAVVITDDDLNELDAVEILMLPDVDRDHRWDWLDRIREQPEVLAMHMKSGLISALLVPEAAVSTRFASHHLDSWLGSAHQGHTITEPGHLVLAGASVAFDRKVLERHLPQAARWFHYRQIDVSSIKELAKRWAPAIADDVRTEDRPHRALADIRGSIDLLRRYRAAGFIGSPATQVEVHVEGQVVLWYHLDGTVCVAGWHTGGPMVGQCSAGGGPITPSPKAGFILRSAAADRLTSIAASIGIKADRMAEECSKPPCLHADGLRLAVDVLRDEASR